MIIPLLLSAFLTTTTIIEQPVLERAEPYVSTEVVEPGIKSQIDKYYPTRHIPYNKPTTTKILEELKDKYGDNENLNSLGFDILLDTESEELYDGEIKYKVYNELNLRTPLEKQIPTFKSLNQIVMRSYLGPTTFSYIPYEGFIDGLKENYDSKKSKSIIRMEGIEEPPMLPITEIKYKVNDIGSKHYYMKYLNDARYLNTGSYLGMMGDEYVYREYLTPQEEITNAMLVKYLYKTMQIKGEKEFGDKELSLLLRAYGTEIPLNLPPELSMELLRLYGHGIVTPEEINGDTLDDEVTFGDLLKYVDRLKNEHLRVKFHEIQVVYSFTDEQMNESKSYRRDVLVTSNPYIDGIAYHRFNSRNKEWAVKGDDFVYKVDETKKGIPVYGVRYSRDGKSYESLGVATEIGEDEKGKPIRVAFFSDFMIGNSGYIKDSKGKIFSIKKDEVLGYYYLDSGKVEKPVDSYYVLDIEVNSIDKAILDKNPKVKLFRNGDSLECSSRVYGDKLIVSFLEEPEDSKAKYTLSVGGYNLSIDLKCLTTGGVTVTKNGNIQLAKEHTFDLTNNLRDKNKFEFFEKEVFTEYYLTKLDRSNKKRILEDSRSKIKTVNIKGKNITIVDKEEYWDYNYQKYHNNLIRILKVYNGLDNPYYPDWQWSFLDPSNSFATSIKSYLSHLPSSATALHSPNTLPLGIPGEGGRASALTRDAGIPRVAEASATSPATKFQKLGGAERRLIFETHFNPSVLTHNVFKPITVYAKDIKKNIDINKRKYETVFNSIGNYLLHKGRDTYTSVKESVPNWYGIIRDYEVFLSEKDRTKITEILEAINKYKNFLTNSNPFDGGIYVFNTDQGGYIKYTEYEGFSKYYVKQLATIIDNAKLIPPPARSVLMKGLAESQIAKLNGDKEGLVKTLKSDNGPKYLFGYKDYNNTLVQELKKNYNTANSTKSKSKKDKKDTTQVTTSTIASEDNKIKGVEISKSNVQQVGDTYIISYNGQDILVTGQFVTTGVLCTKFTEDTKPISDTGNGYSLHSKIALPYYEITSGNTAYSPRANSEFSSITNVDRSLFYEIKDEGKKTVNLKDVLIPVVKSNRGKQDFYAMSMTDVNPLANYVITTSSEDNSPFYINVLMPREWTVDGVTEPKAGNNDYEQFLNEVPTTPSTIGGDDMDLTKYFKFKRAEVKLGKGELLGSSGNKRAPIIKLNKAMADKYGISHYYKGGFKYKGSLSTDFEQPIINYPTGISRLYTFPTNPKESVTIGADGTTTSQTSNLVSNKVDDIEYIFAGGMLFTKRDGTFKSNLEGDTVQLTLEYNKDNDVIKSKLIPLGSRIVDGQTQKQVYVYFGKDLLLDKLEDIKEVGDAIAPDTAVMSEFFKDAEAFAFISFLKDLDSWMAVAYFFTTRILTAFMLAILTMVYVCKLMGDYSPIGEFYETKFDPIKVLTLGRSSYSQINVIMLTINFLLAHILYLAIYHGMLDKIIAFILKILMQLITG